MQNGHKLAAGAAWVATKLRALLGARRSDNTQERGEARRQATLSAGQADSAHPYLLLLPPNHPRG